MHPAAEKFFAMSKEQQRAVHLRLCEQALGVWQRHYSPGTRPTYQETITGTVQELDVDLPSEALACSRAGKDQAQVQSRYSEPITALQDDDLVLPEQALYAYYAIYNLFRAHVIGVPLDPWLIVNQALSALGPEADVALERAVDKR